MQYTLYTEVMKNVEILNHLGEVKFKLVMYLLLATAYCAGKRYNK